MKQFFRVTLLVGLIGMLSGCQSNEIAESKTVDQNSIFQEYDLMYSERTGYSTIKATFRHGGFHGTTLLLSKPSKVTFNGHKMAVDSNFISGAFYHYQSNEKLTKKHPLRFVFTDVNGKKYVNEYTLNLLKWKEIPKQTAIGKDLEIPVYELPIAANERIKVWLTDEQHSSGCRGKVYGGKLVISHDALKEFKGTLTVEITREYQEDVNSSGSEGGQCTISYEYAPFTVELR